MCCLCSDKVTEASVYAEVARFSRIFIGADVPASVPVAIAMRVIVTIAQSRDAYHQIQELQASPEMVGTIVSDFIDEAIDYARTFNSDVEIDVKDIRRHYVVLTRALSLVGIEIDNSLSVAWLSMADSILCKANDDESVKQLVAYQVELFNAEKEAFADPDNYGAGFDGN